MRPLATSNSFAARLETKNTRAYLKTFPCLHETCASLQHTRFDLIARCSTATPRSPSRCFTDEHVPFGSETRVSEYALKTTLFFL